MNTQISNPSNRTHSHIAETFLGLEQPDSPLLRYVKHSNEIIIKPRNRFRNKEILFEINDIYIYIGSRKIYLTKIIIFNK